MHYINKHYHTNKTLSTLQLFYCPGTYFSPNDVLHYIVSTRNSYWEFYIFYDVYLWSVYRLFFKTAVCDAFVAFALFAEMPKMRLSGTLIEEEEEDKR